MDTADYEVRSLCWKGSELEHQRESSPRTWYNQQWVPAELGDRFWQTATSPAPFLGESQKVRLDRTPSLARDATACTRCSNTWSMDIIDGICSLCACVPQEDWELPFDWTAQGNPMETACEPSPNNTNPSYTLDPNSINEDWMFRDSNTLEKTPAGESSFGNQSFRSICPGYNNYHGQNSSAPSLEIPRHVYPIVERESAGFAIHINAFAINRFYPSSSNPTQETLPRFASRRQLSPWKQAKAKFRAYFV